MVNSIRILFFALACIISLNVNASKDLDKWNSAQGKTVRAEQLERLEKTTYREISSKPNPRVSDNLGTVYPQIEQKATVEGSKTKVVAEAVLDVDKEKVARDWNDKLKKAGKIAGGTLASAGFSIAAQYVFKEFMDGLDWVMDEGGKVTKSPSVDPNVMPNHPYVFRVNVGNSFQYYSTEEKARAGLVDLVSLIYPSFVPRSEYSTSLCSDITVPFHNCSTGGINIPFGLPNSGWGDWHYYGYATIVNPNYDPSAPAPERIVIPEEQIINEIKKEIDSSTSKNPENAKKLISESYGRIWDEDGNMMEIGSDIINKQKDILKDDDPKTSGKTTNDPKLETGREAEGEIEPKPNPEPETIPDPDNPTQQIPNPNYKPNTNTGSSIKLDFPKFCSWAAVVCDFIDWVKEEPDLPQEDSEIEHEPLDIGWTPYALVNFDASCPPDLPLELNIIGSPISTVFPLTPFCTFFIGMQPFVLLLGMFLSVKIVAGAVSNTVF